MNKCFWRKTQIKFLKIIILQSLQNNMIGRQSTWQQMCRAAFVCLDVEITTVNWSLSDGAWRCDAIRNVLFIELFLLKRDRPRFSCCHLTNKCTHTDTPKSFIGSLLIIHWNAHVENCIPFLNYCNKYFAVVFCLYIDKNAANCSDLQNSAIKKNHFILLLDTPSYEHTEEKHSPLNWQDSHKYSELIFFLHLGLTAQKSFFFPNIIFQFIHPWSKLGIFDVCMEGWSEVHTKSCNRNMKTSFEYAFGSTKLQPVSVWSKQLHSVSTKWHILQRCRSPYRNI